MIFWMDLWKNRVETCLKNEDKSVGSAWLDQACESQHDTTSGCISDARTVGGVFIWQQDDCQTHTWRRSENKNYWITKYWISA